MFSEGVIWEEVVGADGFVRNGVMDEGDEASPARGARAVAAEGEVVGEWGNIGR